MKCALEAWRSQSGVGDVLAGFENFAQGAALEDCGGLEPLFIGQGLAEELMQSLITHYARAIALNPLGHPPFRNGFDGRRSTMQLATSGRAQLVLQSCEPGTFQCATASYSDNDRFDAVLAGKAQAQILRIHGPEGKVAFTGEPITLQKGVRLGFDCSAEMLLLESVEKRLVTLRLLRGKERSQPRREYCRETGTLLLRTDASLSSSRREMMAAFLGRTGREDAVPVLSEIALRPGEASLRWQALRECLALDTAQGFLALSIIAGDAQDALVDDACALRAQLLEAHPQLRQLEKA